MNLKNTLSFFIIFIFLIFSSFLIFSAPKAELWERWGEKNETSQKTINHDAWDKFLKQYLNTDSTGINRLSYQNVQEDDKAELIKYLKNLTDLDIDSYSSDEQKAYWVNLYNALTVKIILENYPTTSITKIDISPGFFSFGPWDKKLVRVSGEEISLNDIEHRILRPIWKDPRIHYAVNCASISCPNLAIQAYTGSNIEKLLESGAREYINHPRGVTVKKNGDLIISNIYEWFSEDFGKNESEIVTHLAQYAKPILKAQLKQWVPNMDIDYEYDWGLNE